MSWTLSVLEAAERDLSSACEWYNARSPGLGDEFLDQISTAMKDLSVQPLRQPLYFGNFRRIILRRFPYKVFYQVIGEKVVVFRVLHARQDHHKRIP